MRLRPDNAPPMIVGEARNFVFKLAGAVGANTISTFTPVSINGLTTYGSAAISGTNVTVKVTAANSGDEEIKATAVLSSAETVIGILSVKIHDPESSTSDYSG